MPVLHILKMADLVEKRGITLRISFEDFILFPLFIVLIFLSIRICIRKLKRNQSKDSYKCPNEHCLRCKGPASSGSELLAKLHQFAKRENLKADSLSRLKRSILREDIDTFSSNEVRQSPTVLHLLHITAKPIHHSVHYSLCEILHTVIDIKKIRDELYDVFDREYLWSHNEVESGLWKLYYFYNQGVRQDTNCDNCPETAKMISRVESFMASVAFGNAAFSCISQNTRVEAHYGSTNVRLRCHITLEKGGHCTLTAGDECVAYEDGKVIVFDDSFKHSVVHERGDSGIDDKNRIILILDLWHPEVTEVERKAIRYLY